MRSAIFTGTVFHRRLRPRSHSLRYSVFSLLIDLDEIPSLSRRLKLLRFNRGGVLSFRESDHGSRGEISLRDWVERRLEANGISLKGGRIAVLAYPRMFGYVFNPLSVFFCYATDNSLAAILYEVANTYGERHSYVIAVEGTNGRVDQSTDKAFYVSPFLPMEGQYRFQIEPPGDRVGVSVNLHDGEGLLLAASFVGDRKPLTDARLLALLFRYPLMTLKVMGAIHWEALKLWRKGIRFRPHTPAAPQETETPPAATTRRAA
jgi:DUF1365 family protein